MVKSDYIVCLIKYREIDDQIVAAQDVLLAIEKIFDLAVIGLLCVCLRLTAAPSPPAFRPPSSTVSMTESATMRAPRRRFIPRKRMPPGTASMCFA